MLISWVRMVAVRARAWKVEASAPAARVRLCAIAAQTSQAAFALKCPPGQVGQRGVFEVGDDLFNDGVVAVGGLGVEHRLRVVGEYRVIAVDGE
jgi:hypothetical protein